MPDKAPSSPEELIARVHELPAARPLLARLNDATGVHLVGGAVRDLLLGGSPSDLDLVVEGDAGELASALTDTPRRHDRFGTATFSIDGHTYDLASARRESYPQPGALPEIEPASLAEDLGRRDFTVNAMAIALGGPRPGELHQVPGAQQDLDASRLRVLHPRSFEDDPTRLLRLARYASRLGFAVEDQTEALARSAVEAGALRTVSGPRIGTELRLLLREPDPPGALAELHRLSLDHSIAAGFGLSDPDLARRALRLLPQDGRADLLVLSVALLRVPRDRVVALLDALAFEHHDRDVIATTASRAERIAAELRDLSSGVDIAQALAGAPVELAALAGALGAEEQASQWLGVLRHVKLEIDGTDLLAAGIPEGPAVGHALRAALVAKLSGRAESRGEELAEALRAARGSG